MEGFKEDLDFKLSPNGGVGFELAEKTGTSKGRKVETSGGEWVGCPEGRNKRGNL